MNEYGIRAVCSVCGKSFWARYNVGRRAKTCTPKGHRCRRGKVKGKIVSCVSRCCRSLYRAGASVQAMDSAIDPRKVLSPEEFKRAISLSQKLPLVYGVAIRFLAETGCRLGELLLVRKEHLLLGDSKTRLSSVKIPTLKRRGQGRPLRTVHLDGRSKLIEDLRQLTTGKNPQDPVFPVARRTLCYAIEKVLKRVKPERDSLAHIFRHTRASRLVAAGAPMNYVRQQLGWSSLEMAKIYAHTDEEEIGRVFDQLRSGA